MAQQVINIGAAANDGTGDPARTAFSKAKDNFAELYTDFSASAAETTAGATITAMGFRRYDLRRFGVGFNDSSGEATSNTTILNALGAASWPSDVMFVWPEGGICRINDTVTFSNIYIAHWFGNHSEIHYYGAADRPAFVYGNTSTSRGSKIGLGGAGIYLVNQTTNPFTNDDFIGVQFVGTVNNREDWFRYVSGFTAGWQVRGPASGGIAYNKFHLGNFLDNKYHIDLHSFDAGTFINENQFFGGSFRCSGLSNAIDSYGIRFKAESGAYQGHNRNIFYKPSFELQNATGSTYRTPVFFEDAGGNNVIDEARVETGRTAVMRITSPTFAVSGNRFRGAIFAGTWTSYVSEVDSGLSYNNSLVDTVLTAFDEVLLYDSGDILKKAWPSSTTGISVKGMIGGTNASGTITATTPGTNTFKIGKDWIISTASTIYLGVKVDTTFWKNFVVRKVTRAARGGRLNLVLYDASGAILGGAGDLVSGGGFAETSGAGGYRYTTSADSSGVSRFRVASTVAYMHFYVSSGTNPLNIRQFQIFGLNQEQQQIPLRVFTDQSADEYSFYSTGVPTTNLGGGFVARGQMVWNQAAASGQPSGWVCTAEGYLAKAWVLSTLYVYNQMVTNDTGKTYVMTAESGTSAGSGGPTGTGSGITDNGCTWNYIGTQATFSAMANL